MESLAVAVDGEGNKWEEVDQEAWEQGAGIWQHSLALGKGGRPSGSPLKALPLAAEPMIHT